MLAAGVAALELVVIVVVVLAAFAKPFSNDSDIVAAVTPGKKVAQIEASTPAADQVKKQKSAPAPVAKRPAPAPRVRVSSSARAIPPPPRRRGKPARGD